MRRSWAALRNATWKEKGFERGKLHHRGVRADGSSSSTDDGRADAGGDSLKAVGYERGCGCGVGGCGVGGFVVGGGGVGGGGVGGCGVGGFGVGGCGVGGGGVGGGGVGGGGDGGGGDGGRGGDKVVGVLMATVAAVERRR
eukprot:720214-Pleurochrysis_carterae.AAC.2